MIADMSFVPRRALPPLQTALEYARIVAIVGPRQAGKTTLARLIPPPEDGAIGYVTFDEHAPRNAASSDPDGFVAALPRPVVIDEVQRVPDIMLALKAVVDRDRTPGQFIVTGSADLAALRMISDTLPGRIDYVDLWPFAQCELERSTGSLLDDLLAGHVPMLRDCPIGVGAYGDRILRGGFPEAVERPHAARASYFDGYLRAIFEHDVPSVTRRNPATARRVLEACATSTATVQNATGIGRLAGVDTKTALAHLDLLESLFLTKRIPAWSPNRTKRQVRSPKLVVADSGLTCHLVNADGAALSPLHPMVGTIVETFAVTELVRLASFAKARGRLFHFRDRDGHEVDLVVEGPGGAVVGIEIKAGASISRSSFSGLRFLRALAGDDFVCGIVLHTGAATLPFGDDLWAVPLAALWS